MPTGCWCGLQCLSKLWYGCAVVMTGLGCSIFCGAGGERCFEYMCAGIGQDVVQSIPSGWCDVGGGSIECWLVGV